MNIEQFLEAACKLGASDVHLLPGERPVFRINGDLRRVEGEVLSDEHIKSGINRILPAHLRPTFEEYRGVDFSYQLGTAGRFRCVAFFEKDRPGLCMRVIPIEVPRIADLEFPNVIRDIAAYHRGMVLVTGITGCGKSTTLASMIHLLNRKEARRIITIEDPIEYVYMPEKSVISQREVGKDIMDFTSGLRQAMRMDPDVILIGEMRDVETIRVAIKASETGHLVFSTLHTTNAIHTVQRIISHFDEGEQALVREQLSLNLRASITQRLMRRAKVKGRIAALEIMVATDVCQKLIRDNRIADIQGVMKAREDGMQVFDQAIADHVRSENITFEEAQRHCDDFYALRRYVQGVQSSGEKGAIIG